MGSTQYSVHRESVTAKRSLRTLAVAVFLLFPTVANAGDLGSYQASAPAAPVCLLDSGAPAVAQVISSAAVDGGSGADNKQHGTDMVNSMVKAWPGVRIRSVRVTDQYGRLTPSQFADGVRVCLSYPDVQVVLSASTWPGTPTGAENVQAALTELRASGRSFVVSSGNGGTIEFPATLPESITVGAVDGEDSLCEFSAEGAGIDVFAVGCSDQDDVWGTSPASARAAVALTALRGAHPEFSREQAEASLVEDKHLDMEDALARTGVVGVRLAQPAAVQAGGGSSSQLARPTLRSTKVTRSSTTLRFKGRPAQARTVVKMGGQRFVVSSSRVTLKAGGKRKAKTVRVSVRYQTSDGQLSRVRILHVKRF